MTQTKIDLSRRHVLAAGAGAALLPWMPAIAQSGEIVFGAAPPITGVFAFAGVGLHQGLGDYCEWRNTKGGIAGRKIKYIGDDSAYKMDQAMSVFKKIMGADGDGFAPSLAQQGRVGEGCS